MQVRVLGLLLDIGLFVNFNSCACKYFNSTGWRSFMLALQHNILTANRGYLICLPITIMY